MSLLVAGTEEAYNHSLSELTKFVEENEDRKKLINQWLQWWHNRRHKIFRAFTGFNKPRSNLAEVIHASWVQRDMKGLTLLESAEFDTRDSLILERELKLFATNIEASSSKGPSFNALRKRSLAREEETAIQKGSDFVVHG